MRAARAWRSSGWMLLGMSESTAKKRNRKTGTALKNELVGSGVPGNQPIAEIALAALLLRFAARFLWIRLVLAALSTDDANSPSALVAASLSPDSIAASVFLRNVLMRLLAARLSSVRTSVWRTRFRADLVLAMVLKLRIRGGKVAGGAMKGFPPGCQVPATVFQLSPHKRTDTVPAYWRPASVSLRDSRSTFTSAPSPILRYKSMTSFD